MISLKTNPVELSPDQLTSLAKLLLNSWSAEYALRITPLLDEENFVESARHWTFPQAYYSVLFSARAVLLTKGQFISNEAALAEAMSKLAQGGFYGVDFTADNNPYVSLKKYRITEQAPLIPANKVITHQEDLITQVAQTNQVHERHILKSLGAEKYSTIVYSLPSYLRESFVGHRLMVLTTQSRPL